MKITIKKQIRLGVALFSSMILVACGNGGASKTEDSGVLRVGQQTQQNSKLPEGDTYQDNAYRRLIEKELGVKVESAFEGNGDEYDRQVSLAISSGELPDVMTVSRDVLEELVDNDMVGDLTEVYDKYASDNIKSIYDSFDGVQLASATFDGKLYALPGTANDFGPNLVWIRQDWVDKLGLKLDEDGNHAISLNELKETAKAFVEKDASGTGKTKGFAFVNYLTGGDHGGTGFTASAIFNAYGAYPKYYLKDDDGKFFYGSNTEESKKALGFLNGLYKEKLLDNQFGTRTFDDISAMMVNGELGIVPGPWHLSDWSLVQARTANPSAEFVPYALESEDGKVNAVSKPGVGGYVVVRKGYSNPKVVMQMINLIFDEVPNSQNMEEEYPEIYNYAKQAVDGSVRPINIEMFKNLSEISDAEEAVKGATGEIDLAAIPSFTIRNNAEKMKAYLDNPTGSDPTDWAVYASRKLAINDTMSGVRKANILNDISAPLIVQTVKAEERNGAQTSKLEEETFIKFVTGAESLDKFDDYVKTWESQGGKEILAERQKIVDDK